MNPLKELKKEIERIEDLALTMQARGHVHRHMREMVEAFSFFRRAECRREEAKRLQIILDDLVEKTETYEYSIKGTVKWLML